MKIGSLFTGIGGLDLGAEWSGHDVQWQCEIDPYCRSILEKNWPTLPIYEDITQVEWSEVDPIDILMGGFPCQDLSVANPFGKGINGDRSGLWFEMAKVIKVLDPEYIIIENVPMLLRRGLESVLVELDNMGYFAEWDCIPALSLNAPHRRDRFFMIACRSNNIDLKSRIPIASLQDGKWVTSQKNLFGEYIEFSYEWPRAGIISHGKVFELKPLVPIYEIQGKAEWPTPRNCDAMTTHITPEKSWDPKRNPNLETVVGRKLFPTPIATDGNKSPTGSLSRVLETGHPKGKKDGTVRKVWPTPVARYPGASDSNSSVHRAMEGSKHSIYLPQAVKADAMKKTYLTPTSYDGDRSEKFKIKTLAKRYQKHPDGNLIEQIAHRETRKIWRTPTATEGQRGVGNVIKKLLKSQKGQVNLEGVQIHLHTEVLIDKLMKEGLMDEEDLPEEIKGQLNPEFVNWLMGFPSNWTHLNKPSGSRGSPIYSRTFITDSRLNGKILFTETPLKFDYWTPEPSDEDLPKITLKSSNRSKRLKCLGNAVVPELAYYLFQLLNKYVEGVSS